MKEEDREEGLGLYVEDEDEALCGHPSFSTSDGSKPTLTFYQPIFGAWTLQGQGWKGLGERGLKYLAQALQPKAGSGVRLPLDHSLFRQPPLKGCMLVSKAKARGKLGLAFLKAQRPPYLKIRMGTLKRAARGKRPVVWMGAHEFVAWACHGPPDVEKGGPRSVVCHKCHNSMCLHPRHLEHGTDEQNLKMSKARGSMARGRGGKFVGKGP